MLAAFEAFRLSLDAIDPRLWPFTIAVAVGFAYYLWRAFSPTSFEKLPDRLKALPGLVLAAVMSGLTSPELGRFILEVIIGSLGATGGHEFFQRILFGSKQNRVLKKKERQEKST